jgi:hypothetical protein
VVVGSKWGSRLGAESKAGAGKEHVILPYTQPKSQPYTMVTHL